jgi:septal ring factor EnvC (AmiA/AmiB activator)
MRVEEAAEKLREIEDKALRDLAKVEDQVEHAEARLEKVTAMLASVERELKERSWEVSTARQESIRLHDAEILQRQNEIRTLTKQVEALKTKLADNPGPL